MIAIYFGSPGCGKTSFAVKQLIKNQKRYMYCYANFGHTVGGAYKFTLAPDNVLGEKSPPFNSYTALDEAGIEYNNRSYKTMPKPTIAWFKKHRHYGVDVDVFSQDIDMDITIQRLAVQYWVMYRIGPWTLCRRMYKKFGVDKITHQPCNMYTLAHVLTLFLWPLQYVGIMDWKWKLTFRPFYYKYFDTYEREDLPLIDAEYVKYFDNKSCSVWDTIKSKFNFK